MLSSKKIHVIHYLRFALRHGTNLSKRIKKRQVKSDEYGLIFFRDSHYVKKFLITSWYSLFKKKKTINL